MSKPKTLEELRVKIFADGADKTSMVELSRQALIKGFTTNPTLMRKVGVVDYVTFAKDVLSLITEKPISFEVFADEFSEMQRQAKIIASWARNIYVKIPITNTQGESSFDLVKKLAREGVKLNITAILTADQVKHIARALSPEVPAIISVFAGRIADTGVDPVPIMKEAVSILCPHKNYELLWASPRELYNIYQAEEVGADIITVSPEVLGKAELIGLDLHQVSLRTVQMFYDDGKKAGYSLSEASAKRS